MSAMQMGLMTMGRSLLQGWLGNGRTQTQLALKLGIGQSAVSLWIHGKSRPESHLREAIALLTGIPAIAWDTPDERAAVERIRADLEADKSRRREKVKPRHAPVKRAEATGQKRAAS